MFLLLMFFVTPLFASFFCSLLEAVLLSTSSAYIAVSVKKGHPSGMILQDLKKQVDRPLAAILTLNTIVQTAGAAGIGAQAQRIWGNEAVAIVSGVMTFAILVLSEIIPKTIGVAYWKRLAPYSAYLIRVLIVLAYPFVLLSEKISSLLRTKQAQLITREEVIETAEMGATHGSLGQKETRVIKNLLELNNVRVSDIMTPKREIFALQAQKTVGEVMGQMRKLRYSRIPIYERTLDQIVGVVHRYKLLEAYSQDADNMPVSRIATQVSKVFRDVSVASVLDQFVQRREHLFVVIDDRERTVGVVTFDDAIEALLGVEILDSSELQTDFRLLAQNWRFRRGRQLHPIERQKGSMESVT